MNLPDPIERLETSAEDWWYENVDGSQFTCFCGELCDLYDGHTLSANPYAIPVCPKCAEEHYKKYHKDKNNG